MHEPDDTGYEAGKADGKRDLLIGRPPFPIGKVNYYSPDWESSYENGYRHGYYGIPDSKSAARKVSRRRRR